MKPVTFEPILAGTSKIIGRGLGLDERKLS